MKFRRNNPEIVPQSILPDEKPTSGIKRVLRLRPADVAPVPLNDERMDIIHEWAEKMVAEEAAQKPTQE